MAADEVIVRTARADDIPHVLALWERARSRSARTVDDEGTVARLLERSPDALLVAEHRRRIVGAVIAAWDGWRGNMYRLAVLPEQRRRGIATALVEAGHDRLRAQGARRVGALVDRDDADAAGFWRAAGYERDEVIARFVRNL